MPSKSILIALAAFAVTTTGAQAYVGTKYYNQSGLSTSQVQAFQQARDLRRKGETEKARDVLLEAGVTEETIESLRYASKASRGAIYEAVESGNFAAFKEVIKGTPLYDIITTEEDFKLFRKAHGLKEDGKFIEAKEILDDLGVSPKGMGGRHGKMFDREHFLELSNEQRDALRVARQANDHKTVQEILREAGISEAKLEHKMERRQW